MRNDSELTELRDTLAIEITREMCRIMPSTTEAAAIELFRSTYEFVDAVLSGRDRNAKAGSMEGWYAPNRCQICGWPLKATLELGCIPGNCSYRPGDRSAEWPNLKRRREWVEKQPDWEAILAGNVGRPIITKIAQVAPFSGIPTPIADVEAGHRCAYCLAGVPHAHRVGKAISFQDCELCAGTAAPGQEHRIPSNQHPLFMGSPQHCSLCADLPEQNGKHEAGTIEHPGETAPEVPQAAAPALPTNCSCQRGCWVNKKCEVHGEEAAAKF